MMTTLEEVKKFNLQNKYRVIGGVPNNPITIQEKLRWLNIYDIPWSDEYNMPLKSVCADKILLHNYSYNTIGDDICIPIIDVYNNANEIDFQNLPNKFVIKCNHGSGMNIICKDKNKLNIISVKNQLNSWLKQDYTFRNGFESHYHWIDRKVYVEEYMSDTNADKLTDYKFYCMNGEPQFIHVIDDRYSGHMHFTFYDLEFNKLTLEQTNHPRSNYVLGKPSELESMIELARELSKPFKFARVDLYEINSTIYLGEITFVPDVGVFHYRNKDDEVRIGNLLSI